ncbi:hypothetical protein, partial [Candidatus Magnetaquicoccus inordinatus]|uniref:hypothetical protein n=1 Tax=Candidatus Magnetaquicoccus inordinatus TaxID=2496818 RepID=UPI00102D2591
MKESERSALFDSLDEIRERLRIGINNGHYKPIPLLPSHIASAQAMGVNISFEQPMERILFTMLKCLPRDQRYIVWCDDRCLSGFFQLNGNMAIGVLEILTVLEREGALTQEQRFAYRHRLRSARLLYLSMEADEIVYYLRRAPFHEEKGELEETVEMVTLRRYLATALLHYAQMQMPDEEEIRREDHGEIPVLLGCLHALTDALLEFWRDEKLSENHRKILSDWVISNLFVSYLPVMRREGNSHYKTIEVTGLLWKGIIYLNKEADLPRLQCFFQWIHDRLLRDSLWNTPGFLVDVSKGFKEQALNLYLSDEFGEFGPNWIQYLAVIASKELPAPIRKELFKDPKFINKIGLQQNKFYNVEMYRFESATFWRAVSDAISHGEAPVQTSDAQQMSLRVSIDSEGENRVVRLEQEGIDPVLFDISYMFFLLIPSLPDRIKYLQQHQSWFDCSGDHFDKIVAELANIEDPVRRIEQVEQWREKSTEIFYQRLHKKIVAGGFSLSPDNLLPPSGKRWLDSMRLCVDAADPFAKQWAEAADSLVQDQGLESALQRMLGLPLALPEPLVAAIAGLAESEREALLFKLTRAAITTLEKIHLLWLLLRFNVTSQKEAAGTAWMDLLHDLLSTESQNEVRAFTIILHYM